MQSTSTSAPLGAGHAPLTEREKQYLKKHYGNEFHFLRAYALSIYKEEDREEGREILRGMMEAEDNMDDEEDDESENSFLADLEADPMSHLADRFFDEQQLDWIKKHYRHSANFLLSVGLKPYDDEDCQEGVIVCRQFMAPS